MGDQHNQANQPTPAGGQPGGPQPGYQGQQPMPNTPVNDPGKMQPVTPQTPPPGTPGAPPSPPMVSFPSPGMAPHYGGQMPQQPMATPGGVQPPQVGAPQDIVAYWKEQYRAEKDRADDLARQLQHIRLEGEQHRTGRERARSELEQARRERDQAVHDRNQAVHDRNQAIRERDQALRYFNDMKARVEGVRPQEEVIADPPGFQEEEKYHPHVRAFPDGKPAYLLAGGWRIAGGSVRGRSHQNGKYRDDEFAVHPIADKAALIAIADGVGSKELSRWGAYWAVRGAGAPVQNQEYMQRLLSLIQQSKDADDTTQEESVKFLLAVLKAASESVLQYASQQKWSPDDLHSTFIAYLVVPKPDRRLFVASAQIGDGALILRRPGQKGVDWLFLQEPQFTGIDSKVVPFLRFNQDKWPSICNTHIIEPGSTLMGMTDGTVDDMSTKMDEESTNFKDYEDFYAKMRDQALNAKAPGTGMVEFLKYRKRASGDDRTIVCVY